MSVNGPCHRDAQISARPQADDEWSEWEQLKEEEQDAKSYDCTAMKQISAGVKVFNTKSAFYDNWKWMNIQYCFVKTSWTLQGRVDLLGLIYVMKFWSQE